VTYQTSRVVKRTRIPQGAVKRMSLSVLVDQIARWEGQGARAKRVLDAPSPEKLKTIREVVAASIGFSEARGDQLTVDTLPFESTLGAEPPADPAPVPLQPNGVPLPSWMQKYVKDMPAGLLIGVALGALVILVAPLALLLLKRRKKIAALTESPALVSATDAGAKYQEQLEAHAADQQRLEAEALMALKAPPPGTKKSDILSKHLKKTVKQDPAISAQLLRTWMEEEAD
jgi:flagellar M-ring protein FliF